MVGELLAEMVKGSAAIYQAEHLHSKWPQRLEL